MCLQQKIFTPLRTTTRSLLRGGTTTAARPGIPRRTPKPLATSGAVLARNLPDSPPGEIDEIPPPA
jgi:hypothetical protein